MNIEQMNARINILSNEIDDNEEENRAMQDEIDDLYQKIDALKIVAASDNREHSSLAQQVTVCKAEYDSWTPERKVSVRLQGDGQ